MLPKVEHIIQLVIVPLYEVEHFVIDHIVGQKPADNNVSFPLMVPIATPSVAVYEELSKIEDYALYVVVGMVSEIAQNVPLTEPAFSHRLVAIVRF